MNCSGAMAANGRFRAMIKLVTLPIATGKTDLVQLFKQRVEAVLQERPQVHVALSGGSTPKALYALLNKENLPWDKIEWWLGDERWAPPTDETSNERMVRESLGVNRPEFSAHFHSWHTAPDIDNCAINYGRALKAALGQPAVFDLVFLGIGTDGHTASLFPGTAALDETHHNAVANVVPQLNTERLTLTYPVLNASREIWFLAEGASKEPMIRRLMDRDASIPSARITASNQIVYWLKD